MKVGGIRRVVIPPSQGYQNTSQEPIPPNVCTMFFFSLFFMLCCICIVCAAALFSSINSHFFFILKSQAQFTKIWNLFVLRFPWLFINSIWFGIYFMWSWWTLILAPCSGTLFIIHTHLFLIVLQFFDRQRLFTTIFNPTRLANGEGSTLGTLIFDIELVSLRH